MTVKFFHSAMTGAPVLNGVAGSLIGVLDACLVNGFHVLAVDSIEVAGGVATATISAGHPYDADSVALIAGATPAGLNGEQRVLSADGTTLTFDATGIADQTATGTISVKFAPAGWDKPLSAGNVAVYRSADLASTQMYLRVDDSDTLNGRLVGYEAMSDVDTGTGPFPTNTQVSGGLYWPKANGANATARPWLVIADGSRFWYWVNTLTTGNWSDGFLAGFGDFSSNRAGDPYSCVIFGATSSIVTATTTTAWPGYCHVGAGTADCWVPRGYTSLGASTALVRKAESYVQATAHSGAASTSVPYPNGPDGALVLSRIVLTESYHLRGVLPGIRFVPQSVPTGTFPTLYKLPGQGALVGRTLMAVAGGGPAGANTTQNVVFFDITGPWE